MMKLSGIFKLFSYTRLLAILLIIMITFFVFSSIYTIKEGEVGILSSFGKATEVNRPGLHFKFPYPIQDIDIININSSNIMQIQFNSTDNMNLDFHDEEAQVITADDGIILVNMIVEWGIDDPHAYLLKAVNPDIILKNTILSSLKAMAGTISSDSLLGDGKVDLQNSIKKDIQSKISNYSIGIEILDVKILDTKPPEEIKPAYKAVSDAIEQNNTLINKAEEYKNQKIPAAQGEADRMIKEAEAYSEDRIIKAKAETAAFESLYSEYKLSKEVTKSRILIETLEEILPGANIYIMDTKEGTLNHFPIDDIKAIW